MKNEKIITHDCISNMRKEYMSADKSIKYMRFDLDNIATQDGEKRGMTGQRVFVGIEKKKKDGTLYTKEEKTFVTHTHCPFCGIKY